MSQFAGKDFNLRERYNIDKIVFIMSSISSVVFPSYSGSRTFTRMSLTHLRAATFFLTNLEYSKSIELRDTFLNFPPRHHQWDSDCDEYECVNDIRVKVREPLYEGKTLLFLCSNFVEFSHNSSSLLWHCVVCMILENNLNNSNSNWNCESKHWSKPLLLILRLHVLTVHYYNVLIYKQAKRSCVLIPYKACNVLVCGALFMSMGILKLH
jgi:hypothetical protein